MSLRHNELYYPNKLFIEDGLWTNYPILIVIIIIITSLIIIIMVIFELGPFRRLGTEIVVLEKVILKKLWNKIVGHVEVGRDATWEEIPVEAVI